MFKSFFNKKKEEEPKSDANPQDQYEFLFSKSVILIISKLTNNGNWSSEDEDVYNSIIDKLGYSETFEKIIEKEFNEFCSNNSNVDNEIFCKKFIQNFHHIKLSQFAPTFVQSRNTKIGEAFAHILETINRIQGSIDNLDLRTKIISDLRNSENHTSTITECVTPFCLISLGCDQLGRYNIVYSLDPRIREMISDHIANNFIRRIYQFTPGEMEPFTKFSSFNLDCISLFKSDLENAEMKENVKIEIAKRNE